MNVPARTPPHDPETGEITSGLPVGYQAGNQSLAVSIAMAEVDQQITTAHAYPRSVDRAVKNIMTLATLDEETAKECVYALPRGGKPIKGPSIRLAEIIGSQWGNCRVGTRVVHVDRVEKYVEAEGVFHDLETNAATTARVRRRLVADRKTGQITDDMIVLTGNAAASIAKRNAILAAVPKAVWRKAYVAVESVIAGDVKTLVERRGEAMKAFAAFGVTPERVFVALEVGGLDDITLEHMTTLIGMHSALKSGESTVEEMFPIAKPKGDKPTDLKGKLDQLAGEDEVNKPADQAEKSSERGPSPAASGGPGKQDERPPTSTATGSQPPSGAPSPDGGDPIEAATRKGRAAYRNGKSRKANPFKDGPESKAWLNGFDDEAAADGPEPGSSAD
jgi:ribosome modulation factor